MIRPVAAVAALVRALLVRRPTKRIVKIDLPPPKYKRNGARVGRRGSMFARLLHPLAIKREEGERLGKSDTWARNQLKKARKARA